jgi:homoserine kinase type II
MTLAEAQSIGENYGLNVVSLQPLGAGSVNSNFSVQTRAGERFFLRVYEEQGPSDAGAELIMIRELSELGVPTPAPLSRLAGGYASLHGHKPVALHPWIDGDSLCSRRVTPALARRLGHALGAVHACTPSLSRIPEGRFGMAGLLVRLDAVDLADRGYAADTRFIRQRLDEYVARSREPLPSGLIHGDLFRDNVLFRDGELVALLDFESASAGVFAYDIMVCVHAWCYRDAYDLDAVRALLAGYSSVRRLERPEWLALPVQGALAALRFATTRITDFSLRAPAGQAPARDYRRFLGRLAALEAGALDALIKEGI